ncbi:baculoviral IAP repeat-containing protein 1-like [Paramacrobiotus metropolitanus]|uniref:baculoviral IAP repeat-containing protein 1-like n=1 Tax=Paramacrobiotus metropolitanus TaxID=2943436 RepID=UPI002445C7EE|nr:baculoviral IAP repeat-containing protein 1-like [Paramacrobiotus metropolitanus]
MAHYLARLNSFNHVKNWLFTTQTKEDMAAAGFSYTWSNLIHCYHCGLGLRDLLPYEQVDVHHARYRPHCPVVVSRLGLEAIEEIRDLEKRANATSYRVKDLWDRQGPSNGFICFCCEEDALQPPKDMKTTKERLASYPDSWKSEIVHPVRLAAAGFQYNWGNTAECVYCGLVVDNWEKGDDPEEVHRSRQPECKSLCCLY